MLLFIFGAIWFYDRSRGGYRAESIAVAPSSWGLRCCSGEVSDSSFSLLLSIAAAADSDQLAARQALYYQDNSPEVVFQATTVAKKPVPVKLPQAAAGTSRRRSTRRS